MDGILTIRLHMTRSNWNNVIFEVVDDALEGVAEVSRELEGVGGGIPFAYPFHKARTLAQQIFIDLKHLQREF